jgi:hypothetical protein
MGLVACIVTSIVLMVLDKENHICLTLIIKLLQITDHIYTYVLATMNLFCSDRGETF